MKLRLLDDSIRLRLSRSDVRRAEDTGVVEGTTHFPDGTAFVFALEAAGISEPNASFASGRLVVRLPDSEIAAWAANDNAVSLRGELTLADGGLLRLLIEKDFECLTPRAGEDQDDLFPNPESAC